MALAQGVKLGWKSLVDLPMSSLVGQQDKTKIMVDLPCPLEYFFYLLGNTFIVFILPVDEGWKMDPPISVHFPRALLKLTAFELKNRLSPLNDQMETSWGSVWVLSAGQDALGSSSKIAMVFN